MVADETTIHQITNVSSYKLTENPTALFMNETKLNRTTNMIYSNRQPSLRTLIFLM